MTARKKITTCKNIHSIPSCRNSQTYGYIQNKAGAYAPALFLGVPAFTGEKNYFRVTFILRQRFEKAMSFLMQSKKKMWRIYECLSIYLFSFFYTVPLIPLH
jgi:hypothetical protein